MSISRCRVIDMHVIQVIVFFKYVTSTLSVTSGGTTDVLCKEKQVTFNIVSCAGTESYATDMMCGKCHVVRR
jgi:hypothetical protein